MTFKSWEIGSIPRSEMPQIKSTKMQEFLASLEDVDFVVSNLPACNLVQSQAELHEDNILALISGDVRNLEKPLLVSNDGYVLDGHHRWAANARLLRQQPCYLLNCNAEKALQLMAVFAEKNIVDCASKA